MDGIRALNDEVLDTDCVLHALINYYLLLSGFAFFAVYAF